MTITEARKIRKEYYQMTHPKEENVFLFTEALRFLIEETKNSDYMVELGGLYYGKQCFDLALKYYEMAAEYDNLYAISNLGYVWYYGRTGEKNYEKALYYFEKARKMGDLIAAYKVADMYKNGYYVEKDYVKYKKIIEDLYEEIKDDLWFGMPAPEILSRLAGIRAEEGKTEEALELYEEARFYLSERIQEDWFFGNLSIMKWLIRDIYQLRPFDPEDFELYDLYYLLEKPVKVQFVFEGVTHEAEALEEDGVLVIRFDEAWFRTVDDFFRKAELEGERLTTRYAELYNFEVVS